MLKSDPGNFFEDFSVGQTMHCATPRTLTSGDIAAYIALCGDRTPRFCDARLEMHPLLVFHTVLGQTVRSISLNARANLGYAGLRWGESVRHGDTLHTTAEVLGLKENSNLETGIVYVKTVAKNQRDQIVLDYTRWVMVKKRDSSKETKYLKSPVVPELPPAVLVKDLRQMTEALPNQRISGGRYAWKDYQVGERIAHVDGQTINASDHMSFTRLFQNTAKVHFDAILTEGKPLVYGGFPISLGYAQSFAGLENRCGICAINSGAHSNPVYAGDTLYSFTEVVDAQPHGSSANVGALRLRLVVVKNEPLPEERVKSFQIQVENPKKPGSKIYAPNVVLDLDYWDLLPLEI